MNELGKKLAGFGAGLVMSVAVITPASGQVQTRDFDAQFQTAAHEVMSTIGNIHEKTGPNGFAICAGDGESVTCVKAIKNDDGTTKFLINDTIVTKKRDKNGIMRDSVNGYGMTVPDLNNPDERMVADIGEGASNTSMGRVHRVWNEIHRKTHGL